ncbi:MAG TPA: hypothetical protein VHD31_00020 [Candidatus Paceibacterota bacterium]|nr:hypothetical protein [Candidatus Paceibacterota bacterium]
MYRGTKIVNAAYAEAAMAQMPACRQVVIDAFIPMYGADATKMADAAVELMARHIEPPDLTPAEAASLDRQGIAYAPEFVASK